MEMLLIDSITGSYIAALSNSRSNDHHFKIVGPTYPLLKDYNFEDLKWNGIYQFMIPNFHSFLNCAKRVITDKPLPALAVLIYFLIMPWARIGAQIIPDLMRPSPQKAKVIIV